MEKKMTINVYSVEIRRYFDYEEEDIDKTDTLILGLFAGISAKEEAEAIEESIALAEKMHNVMPHLNHVLVIKNSNYKKPFYELKARINISKRKKVKRIR